MKEPGWHEAGPLGGEGMTVEAEKTTCAARLTTAPSGRFPRSIRVVALVERNRRIRSFHVPNNLAPLVARHAHRNSRLMTDESNVHSHAGTWFKSHHTVDVSVKEYVWDQTYTNTIEGFFSILKRGVYGVYQHVSEAH